MLFSPPLTEALTDFSGAEARVWLHKEETRVAQVVARIECVGVSLSSPIAYLSAFCPLPPPTVLIVPAVWNVLKMLRT